MSRKRTYVRNKVSNARARGVHAAKRRVLEVYGKLVCEVCQWRLPLEAGGDVRGLHGHHVAPINEGGSPDDPENVIVVCPNHHTIAHALGPAGYAGTNARQRLIEVLRLTDAKYEDEKRHHSHDKSHDVVRNNLSLMA